METLYSILLHGRTYKGFLTLCQLSKEVSLIKENPTYKEVNGKQYFRDWEITVKTAEGKDLGINI